MTGEIESVSKDVQQDVQQDVQKELSELDIPPEDIPRLVDDLTRPSSLHNNPEHEGARAAVLCRLGQGRKYWGHPMSYACIQLIVPEKLSFLVAGQSIIVSEGTLIAWKTKGHEYLKILKDNRESLTE